MRIFVQFVVIFCLLLIGVGGYGIWVHWITLESYGIASGVAGTIASVISLIGLGTPRLRRRDVQDLEAGLVADLAKTMEQVKQYEERTSHDREEMTRLAQNRAEIELLVRQASLRTFLSERLRNIGQEIEKLVNGNRTLSDFLSEYKDLNGKVLEVSGEIESSPHADLINRVIEDVKNEEPQRSPIYMKFLGIEIDLAPVIRGVAALLEKTASLKQ